MSTPEFFPIPSSALGGAIAVNVFAGLATFALVSVVLRISWVAAKRKWSRSAGEPQEYVFFNTQLGQYAACLIFAMMFNTVAGILGMTWLVEKGIRNDVVCRAQDPLAVLMAIGNVAGGYFTIAIAFHTFGSLVLQMRQSAVICRSTIAMGWALSLVIATAPLAIHHPEGSIYGPDGLLCDIKFAFAKEQFFLHILPILLFSILAAILYSLIFLVLRGTLKIRGGVKLTLNPDERWKDSHGVGENYHRFVAKLARSMLWYPVAYIALLVPYSVLRLFAISGFQVPLPAMIFAFVCWYLLPVADVLLLYNTFRVLGPAFDMVSTLNTRKSRDLESFASPYVEKFSAPSQFQNRPKLEQKIDLHHSSGSSHDRKASDISIASSQQGLLSHKTESLSDYGYVVTTSPPAVRSTPGREPIRSYSPSPTALSMPPRKVTPPSSSRIQTPVSMRHAPPPNPKEVAGYYNQPSIPRKASTSTFGRPSSRLNSWLSDLNPESPDAENSIRQQLLESPRRPMISISRTSSLNSGSLYPRSSRGKWR